ncbi:hypothetical protein [Brevundimonas goettingensis]|uniref:Uncharacterized protein n=1 Tax=Brevundimonas goettingensis TaxID=2774190 RepID=A0A975C115_9CAUL|nr:hypothetical protein [Brevundimonas goettingensis]QTC90454.1 hypothetical protein IFJ75_14375 [Brevundimonas goettingensis]
MTVYASIIGAFAVQLGPPPPLISVVELADQSASAESRAATELIIGKLQPGYVRLRRSEVPAAALEACRTDPAAAASCLSEALSQAGAGSGHVVLITLEQEGDLHWLCVGRNAGPFTASRQSVSLGPLTDLYADGESEVLHRAAACLTYAGNQSGW